jgi:NAD(P)-dependent dehydrogenase (short-subunit alcohol dehydrogenase family)
VTGAGQRIGRAMAVALAEDGWAVAVHHHRSADPANRVVEEIEESGGSAFAIGCDLTREDEVATLVPRCVDRLGPLGLLINNASVFEHDEALTVTRATWQAHMETNLRAPFVLSQGFAAQLPPAAEGNIVNIVDQRVWNLTPHFISYTLSKAGLWTLTQTLALALAPRIRVNAIGPGPTLPSPHQTAAQFAQQCDSMPLGRGATPDDIVAALRYILGAGAVTGQLIAVDGGQHLCWAPSDQHAPED